VNPDAQYVEVTYGMVSNCPDSIPSRYRAQIKQWECRHCDFVLLPDRKLGNFARVSHARSVMRKHFLALHGLCKPLGVSQRSSGE